MGFLRKIGRKIKKGVKKLFSSKIGAFIGSIGLSMIMGPVISRAFNGIKGVFTGAAQTGTQAATTAAGTTAGTAGSVNVVSNTATGAMEQLANTSDLFVDFGSKGSVGLKGEATTAALKEKIVSTAATGPTVGQQIRQNFVNLGTGVKEFTADPFGKTKEYIGDEFIPDVAKSVGTSLALGAIQGEPEQPFISGGVAPQPAMEVAQNAYMATVQNQIPNLPVTNFQQLNQSLLYGTLSPQYLMGQAQYS
jgi:hypothetical protein